MPDIKPTRAYPSLAEPGDALESHSALLRQIKESVQIHERRTSNYLDSFVRVRELIELGLIKVVGTSIVIGDTVIDVDDIPDSGVTDHGALTGLTDDDHTQYVLRSILTTNGDLYARIAGAVTRLGVGTAGQILGVNAGLPAWRTFPLVTKGAAWSNTEEIDAATAPEVTIQCPVAGTIVAVTITTTGGAGDCVIDVEKSDYATFPVTASIAAGAKPTIAASGTKYTDATLTGWTTAIAAGDVLRFQLESSHTFTGITIILHIQQAP